MFSLCLAWAHTWAASLAKSQVASENLMLKAVYPQKQNQRLPPSNGEWSIRYSQCHAPKPATTADNALRGSLAATASVAALSVCRDKMRGRRKISCRPRASLLEGDEKFWCQNCQNIVSLPIEESLKTTRGRQSLQQTNCSNASSQTTVCAIEKTIFSDGPFCRRVVQAKYFILAARHW